MAKVMAEGPVETNVITKLEAIPLSADTAARRVAECISDIDNQLKEIFQQSEAIWQLMKVQISVMWPSCASLSALCHKNLI